MFATFLALGELTNFLRLGFLRYWQRQGFCSLILLQHSVDGGLADVIALTQGLSCVGLHVTAIITCVLARSSTSRVHTTAMYDAFIFHSLEDIKRFVCLCVCVCVCVRERWWGVCGALGWGSLLIYRAEVGKKETRKGKINL